MVTFPFSCYYDGFEFFMNANFLTLSYKNASFVVHEFNYLELFGLLLQLLPRDLGVIPCKAQNSHSCQQSRTIWSDELMKHCSGNKDFRLASEAYFNMVVWPWFLKICAKNNVSSPLLQSLTSLIELYIVQASHRFLHIARIISFPFSRFTMTRKKSLPT